MFLIFESLKISLKILKEHKLRSFLTVLGILIGVTTIIFIHSVLIGVENYIIKEVSALGANTVYITKFSWMNSDWREERKRKAITFEDAEFLKNNCPVISHLAPIIYSGSNIKYQDKSIASVQIIGSSEQYEYTSDSSLEYGRFFNHYEAINRNPVLILGYDIKETIFGQENPIGRNIYVGKKKFTIIGVLSQKGEMFGNSMDKNVIMPIGVLTQYFPYWRSRVIDIAVKIKDPDRLNYSIEKITETMRIARGLDSFTENDFSVNQMSQVLDFYNKMTGSMQILIVIIGSLSLFIGGIGIMNIMLVSVTERTKEIGTRKAIGATKRIIMIQFLMESITLCLSGGVIGIIVGFSIAKIISSVTPLPVAFSGISVLVGVGFSSLVGIVFGLYPAGKAANLQPIEALRYE